MLSFSTLYITSSAAVQCCRTLQTAHSVSLLRTPPYFAAAHVHLPVDPITIHGLIFKMLVTWPHHTRSIFVTTSYFFRLGIPFSISYCTAPDIPSKTCHLQSAHGLWYLCQLREIFTVPCIYRGATTCSRTIYFSEYCEKRLELLYRVPHVLACYSHTPSSSPE